MKKMLLLVLLIPVLVSAQQAPLKDNREKITDTLPIGFGSYGISMWGRTFSEQRDSFYVQITIWQDSTIEITGDTMKAIKLLLSELKKRDSIEENLYMIMRAGVEFLNYVPDYWKNRNNNPKWAKYWALLRKQGYVQFNKKK